jgi:hypothetical protein
MQARSFSTLAASIALAAALALVATPAAAQMDVLVVEGATHAAGGAEATQDVFVTELCDESQSAHVGSANGGVWRAPNEASTSPSDVAAPPAESDALKYNFGGIEGAGAEEAHAPCQDVDSGQQEAQIGLLLPAVQRPRPVADGETETANDPEMPICANCGADAQVQAQQNEAEEQPRRLPNFSVSLGGVTVGSGGVSVAVGDVNGDGGSARREARR